MQKKNFLPILALAVGHLVTDLQAGALPIVLPHLKELFTLSYSQLAAIVLTQNITSSVIQPVFGYITDKRSMPVLLPFCAAMAGGGGVAAGEKAASAAGEHDVDLQIVGAALDSGGDAGAVVKAFAAQLTARKGDGRLAEEDGRTDLDAAFRV